MKTLQNYAYLLVMVLFLVNCKTASEPDPTPVNAPKPQLIAGTLNKSWLVTSIKLDGVEVINQTKPCAKDDLLVFSADKTYERNEGATKCQTKDAQVYEKGTWELATNDTELILNKTARFKLLEITGSTLRYSVVSVFGETRELTLQSQSN